MNLKSIQIILLAGVFVLQFIFEHLFPQRREFNKWQNEKFNFLIGLLNVAVTIVPAIFLTKFVLLINEKQLGAFNQYNFPSVIRFILSLLILDLWMYAWHKLNHILPILWRFHSFHHKDRSMNSTTALRFHSIELLLSYPGKALICFVYGIDYVSLIIYEVSFFISIVIHHSNIYITPSIDRKYRTLFASPLMHRIHHSIRSNEMNSNFGGLFSFWDRLFGTHIKEAEGEIEFGIAEQINK